MKFHRFLLASVAIAVGFAVPSNADTYYWKVAAGTWGSWSTLSNWSTESATGADATALPGSSDKLFGNTSGFRQYDLDGNEWTIAGWNSNGDWDRHYLRFRNGILHWAGSGTTHSDTVHLDDDATFIFDAGSFYHASENHGASDEWKIHAGGTLTMLGTLQIYKIDIAVDDGATMTFAPSELKFNSNSAQQSYLRNSGTLSIPNGISFTVGASGGTFNLQQNAGTLTLGGPVTKNGKSGTYNATLSGGTIHATGNVSFDFTSATIPDGASLEINVDRGASFDLSGLAVGTGTYINKSGAGDIAFCAGHMPGSLYVDAGAVSLDSSTTSYDLSNVSFSSNGKVKINATGVTLTGWHNSLLSLGNFVSGIATPVVGSTLLTCTDASVLARAKAGLDASLPDGFAVTISGNDLVVSSAYVFDSTTVTDLNDPAGWAGGAVPSNKVVTIKGVGVAPTTTDLPPFAGITIMEGASLAIANGGTIPSLTLADSAALTVSSGTVTLGSAPTITPSGANRPSITVASGATLNIPGGSTFTDCSLSISGTLATTSAGDLVLGYAASGEASSFGLTVNGGTLSTSAGDIRFFCPASGGTVCPLGPVAFTGATFTHDNDHGFFFGVNNPAATAITFTFDNTTLNYPMRGDYIISGGSALRFVNGGSLFRDDNQYEYFTLTVSGLASLYLGPGTVSKVGASKGSGESVGNGFITFTPDTDGFVALTIDGASWQAYHAEGNSKAVVDVFGDSAHPLSYTPSGDAYNRKRPFYHAKEIRLNSGATLFITNSINSSSVAVNEKYTGSGSLFYSSTRSTTRTFNFNSTSSTATGTLEADATKAIALVIDPTAKWAGTVVWNGKASINHGSTADAMTFGGVDLASDFTIRVWGNGTCDHYALTGAGFVDNGGKIAVSIADGSEAQIGDEWVFARVPVGTDVPTSSSTSWTISSRAVSGDATVVDLVLSVAASTDYTFESDTITDLSNGAGWSTGSVPTGEDVKISGASTVAIVSDASTFPAFSSIAVRNGATLRVLDNVTLPPLMLDATSKVVIGDGANAVSAILDASLVTFCNTAVSPVALPIIEVATNATLSVASGMRFKNVDFRLYGTVTKAADSDASPTFGYAENGETSYIAFTADGGVFDFHSNQNIGNGSVSIVFPSAGGMVVPVGTITLRNSSRNVTSWADFGDWEFCRNNSTNIPVDILVDGTHMDCSAYFYASGAAHLTLVNGARVQRQSSCLGHFFDMAIQDAATITVGEDSSIDFTTGDGKFGIDSQVAVDTVTVRDGGIYTVTYNSDGWQRGAFVADDGILGVGKIYSTRARTDLLLGFASARLDGDLIIASVNIGTGNTNWDRHMKMTDKPFTGTGNVVISNGVPAYPFSVTFVNGASTATGSIGVAEVEDADTTLYFANGANWAGTVKANGDVRLVTNFAEVTNSAAVPAPVAVSFGGVELVDNAFKLRLWANGTSDLINVGANGWSGNGKLDFEFVDFADAGTREWEIATQPVGTTLPSTKKAAYSLHTKPISGDETKETVCLKVANGIVILLR